MRSIGRTKVMDAQCQRSEGGERAGAGIRDRFDRGSLVDGSIDG